MPKDIYTARRYYSADNDPGPLKFLATRDGDNPLRLHLETTSQSLDVTLTRDQIEALAGSVAAVLDDWAVVEPVPTVTPLPSDPVAVPAPISVGPQPAV